MIRVSGQNNCNQLLLNPTAMEDPKLQNIVFPVLSLLDVSSLLSLSTYAEHSVWVTKDHRAHAIGNNQDGRIGQFIPQQIFKDPIDYQIIDPQGEMYPILSAVCGVHYTLYLVQSNSGNRLVYANSAYHSRNIFIDIGNCSPIALFGGSHNAAAIDSEGCVIIVTDDTLHLTGELNEPTAYILNLPDYEKAVQVCFCFDSIYALSSTGHVYVTSANETGFSSFIEVDELKNIQITQISGTLQHCFAVSYDGYVYGYGLNSRGCLCLGNQVHETSKFVTIDAFQSIYIVAAYAGSEHSIFQTADGALYACGGNSSGQLLVGDISYDFTYLPIETMINKDATFAIVGNRESVIFQNCRIPPFSPNQKIIEEPSLRSFAIPAKSLLEFVQEKEIDKIDKNIEKLYEEERQIDKEIDADIQKKLNKDEEIGMLIKRLNRLQHQ